MRGTHVSAYIYLIPEYPAGTKVQVLRAAGGHTTIFEQTLPAQHQLAPPLELQRYLEPKLNLSLNHLPNPLLGKHSLIPPLEPQGFNPCDNLTPLWPNLPTYVDRLQGRTRTIPVVI